VLVGMYWRAARIPSEPPPAEPDIEESMIAEPVGASHA